MQNPNQWSVSNPIVNGLQSSLKYIFQESCIFRLVWKWKLKHPPSVLYRNKWSRKFKIADRTSVGTIKIESILTEIKIGQAGLILSFLSYGDGPPVGTLKKTCCWSSALNSRTIKVVIFRETDPTDPSGYYLGRLWVIFFPYATYHSSEWFCCWDSQ